jgi:hypothetical protein
MEKYQRHAITEDLQKYCYLAKEHSFIEICDWNNGEGFDVTIESGTNSKLFQLTHGEFKAIKKLVKKLDRDFELPMKETV